MEAFVIIALVGFGLLLAELLLPTGGILAVIGIAGLIVAGLVALDSDSNAADYAGAALITLGLLSGITFYFVTRKVIEAHREQPARTGTEELVGSAAEARSSIDPRAGLARGHALGRPAGRQVRPRSARGIESRSRRSTG